MLAVETSAFSWIHGNVPSSSNYIQERAADIPQTHRFAKKSATVKLKNTI